MSVFLTRSDAKKFILKVMSEMTDYQVASLVEEVNRRRTNNMSDYTQFSITEYEKSDNDSFAVWKKLNCK